ncbi:multi-sensor signal transduction histidine kinase [Chloroherpeton thalassium ATCC 35110]|uniref:histidine kinase n=1 Tax=Chloroherpeton thalassium (strain ATCC 35110 / GB-78) TaxID=517418 RepID=B3QYS6_CHLT3|nr:response regulator [Chloroherpeton thalassium]ACF15149.1 multi-sensor signal transduction histidine kinase [Chloroherpeton thalassium ATCC 35110]
MKYKVLIVEDESVVAWHLQDILEQSGYEVVASVGSGEDAVKLTQTLAPDLILMDISLKGDMDGIEAASQILKICKIPVIFLTAHADKHTLNRAKNAMPYGYIVKPFQEKDVVSAIEIVLNKHQQVSLEKEMEIWLENLLHSVGESVIATDEKGRIKFMNPTAEEMTGWKLNDASGRDISEVFQLFDTKTREPIENPAKLALKENRLVELDKSVLLRAKDGSELEITDSAAPIKDSNGKLSGVVIIFFDCNKCSLTNPKEKQLLEHLRRIKKMDVFNTLSSGFANNFNSLLTGILGNIALLKRDDYMNPDLEKKLDRIEGAASRAALLVKQLMIFSRQAGLSPEPVNLNQEVAHVVETLRKLTDPRIEIHAEFNADRPIVIGDRSQISEMLLAIGLNAHEAIVPTLTKRRQGKMGFSTHVESLSPVFCAEHRLDPEKLYVHVAIADSGIGIKNELKERVFEPFFSTKGSGRGLGLSIVFGIIKNHHGAISFTSIPGQGSLFDIYLPVSAHLDIVE